jgi:hypothetical protein
MVNKMTKKIVLDAEEQEIWDAVDIHLNEGKRQISPDVLLHHTQSNEQKEFLMKEIVERKIFALEDPLVLQKQMRDEWN